jgi:hypothetical protein
LSKSNFSPEHIRKLQVVTKRDPSLLERVVYAFGLLEALSRVGLDFTFKGGTCLLLLLKKNMRLSTDIDIMVKPGIDIELFINKAAKIFPFVGYEENVRRASRNIDKKHFKFFYDSPVSGKRFHILLDVVFEESGYSKTAELDITNTFLNVESPIIQVTAPTINCILGDKLTAFAPHSIGVPYGVDKELEIIKQHFDIAVLMEDMDQFVEVKDTYKRIAEMEISYRELKNINVRDTLADSFKTAITIIGRGNLFPDDFKYLADGMRKVKGHILDNYSPVIAERQSCRIAYLIANILADRSDFHLIKDASSYVEKSITNSVYAKLNYIKKTSLIDFAYLYEAIELYSE